MAARIPDPITRKPVPAGEAEVTLGVSGMVHTSAERATSWRMASLEFVDTLTVKGIGVPVGVLERIDKDVRFVTEEHAPQPVPSPGAVSENEPAKNVLIAMSTWSPGTGEPPESPSANVEVRIPAAPTRRPPIGTLVPTVVVHTAGFP